MIITVTRDADTTTGDRVVAIVTTTMPQVGTAPVAVSVISDQEVVPGQQIQVTIKPGQYLVLEPFVGA